MTVALAQKAQTQPALAAALTLPAADREQAAVAGHVLSIQPTAEPAQQPTPAAATIEPVVKIQLTSTPLQLSEFLWLYSYKDMPSSIRGELNHKIGVYIIEPRFLKRNAADHPCSPGGLSCGFKGLRYDETVRIEELSSRFSSEAVYGLKIFRAKGGSLTITEGGRKPKEIQVAQAGISDVAVMPYACPSSQLAGIDRSFTARFHMSIGLASSSLGSGLKLDPEIRQQLICPIDPEEFKKEYQGRNLLKESCESMLNYCCDELGIPEQLRPKLRILEMPSFGSYQIETNEILVRNFSNINPFHQSSIPLIEVLQVVAHEAFHASRALALKAMFSESELSDAIFEELRAQPIERLCPSLSEVRDPVALSQVSAVLRGMLDDPASSKNIFSDYMKARFTDTTEIMQIDARLSQALQGGAGAADPLLVHRLRDDISFMVNTAHLQSIPTEKPYAALFGRDPSEAELGQARGYIKEVVDRILSSRGHSSSESGTPQSLRDEAHYYFVCEEVCARNFQIRMAKVLLEPLLAAPHPEAEDWVGLRTLRHAHRWHEELRIREELNTECFDLLARRRGDPAMLELPDTAKRIERIKNLLEKISDPPITQFSEGLVAENLLEMLKLDSKLAYRAEKK